VRVFVVFIPHFTVVYAGNLTTRPSMLPTRRLLPSKRRAFEASLQPWILAMTRRKVTGCLIDRMHQTLRVLFEQTRSNSRLWMGRVANGYLPTYRTNSAWTRFARRAQLPVPTRSLWQALTSTTVRFEAHQILRSGWYELSVRPYVRASCRRSHRFKMVFSVMTHKDVTPLEYFLRIYGSCSFD
jgi:hypothetical protein